MKTYKKVPAVVLEALWEAGVIDDSHTRIVPQDWHDDMTDLLQRFLLETPQGLYAEHSQESASGYRWLANYYDDLVEYHFKGEDKKHAKRLRAASQRFAQTLSKRQA